MNESRAISSEADNALEAFAARLTVTAHRVALRYGARGTWIDLELDLWRALADKVKTWGEGFASVPPAGDAAGRVQAR